MPKQKTHSGMKKRARLTGSGKVMREQVNNRHLAEHKSSRRKRRLQMDKVLGKGDGAKALKLLGKR
ncbi:50S ribosomal protein L35 [Sediminivirga luteola]|uniref:Large ribosomal subunit protein bL35 n=1 Tax=Sediminivirga luteola TaxID=1774748 RepID=A0A8J2XLT7_9MICO|nr:50S ribosomal protein L35 [Sediminivirga luteola]MCI2265327.1 50S ribosomal protein L35 [Sediminivirga luteola]GGA24816.1 50S ribosomal protein L35 [Sediminivirga luteola]